MKAQKMCIRDRVSHPNICGFGKTLLEGVMEGKIKELVLVSCCDTIRSVYDILLESGKLDFLYILDVLHCDSACSRERMAVPVSYTHLEPDQYTLFTRSATGTIKNGQEAD